MPQPVDRAPRLGLASARFGGAGARRLEPGPQRRRRREGGALAVAFLGRRRNLGKIGGEPRRCIIERGKTGFGAERLASQRRLCGAGRGQRRLRRMPLELRLAQGLGRLPSIGLRRGGRRLGRAELGLGLRHLGREAHEPVPLLPDAARRPSASARFS